VKEMNQKKAQTVLSAAKKLIGLQTVLKELIKSSRKEHVLFVEAQVIKCATALSIGMEEEDHTQENQARADPDQHPDHMEEMIEIDHMEEIIEIDLVTDKTIILKETVETIEIIEIQEIQEIIVIEDLDLEIVEELLVILVDVEADLEMDQENQEEGIQDQDLKS
jgi:hypothetical protein